MYNRIQKSLSQNDVTKIGFMEPKPKVVSTKTKFM
jgi:hypothetical protein